MYSRGRTCEGLSTAPRHRLKWSSTPIAGGWPLAAPEQMRRDPGSLVNNSNPHRDCVQVTNGSTRQAAYASKLAHNPGMDGHRERSVAALAEALRRRVARHLQEHIDARSDDYPNQASVAKAAGLSQSSISRILRAKQGVTLEVLAAVSTFTDTAAYKLLLPSPDVPNPPSRAGEEGQLLMSRLARVSKQLVRDGRHETPATGPAGGDHHRPLSRPRKKSTSRSK